MQTLREALWQGIVRGSSRALAAVRSGHWRASANDIQLFLQDISGQARMQATKAAAEDAAKRVTHARMQLLQAETAHRQATALFDERHARVEKMVAEHQRDLTLREEDRVRIRSELHAQLYGPGRSEAVAAQQAVEAARVSLGNEIQGLATAMVQQHEEETNWAQARSVIVSYATMASVGISVVGVLVAWWRTVAIVRQTREEVSKELDIKLAPLHLALTREPRQTEPSNPAADTAAALMARLESLQQTLQELKTAERETKTETPTKNPAATELAVSLRIPPLLDAALNSPESLALLGALAGTVLAWFV